MKRFALLFLFIAGTANAVTFNYAPAGPFTIVGPQGRPMPGATVVVTDMLDNEVTIYTTPEGITEHSGLLPQSNVLQFFAAPGVYFVTINGQGITYTFYTVIFDAIEKVAQTSIARSAEMLLTNTSAPPELLCPTDLPCGLLYATTGTEVAFFNFVSPPFPMHFEMLTISWQTLSGYSLLNDAVWAVDWCAFSVGDVPCFPDGTNRELKTSTALGEEKRVDLDFVDEDFPVGFPTADEDLIVITVERWGTNISDTINSDVVLLGVRLDITKDME